MDPSLLIEIAFYTRVRTAQVLCHQAKRFMLQKKLTLGKNNVAQRQHQVILPLRITKMIFWPTMAKQLRIPTFHKQFVYLTPTLEHKIAALPHVNMPTSSIIKQKIVLQSLKMETQLLKSSIIAHCKLSTKSFENWLRPIEINNKSEKATTAWSNTQTIRPGKRNLLLLVGTGPN